MTKIGVALRILAALVFLITITTTAWGQEPATAPEISREQIDSVIRTLEDPATREKLIEQLKVLAEAQEQAEPEPAFKSATAQLLQGLSNRLQSFAAGAMKIASGAAELPRLLVWIQQAMDDPQQRALWLQILINLIIVLGVGYVAFSVVALLLARVKRTVIRRQPDGMVVRSLSLLVVLVIDLVPIAAFAGAAYPTLGFVDPLEKTRLVALAWVNAALIVRVIAALARAVLAPDAPSIRLPSMDEESAHYAYIWVRRISLTGVYGYFALQAALLLGLSETVYHSLMDLLGLFVTALIIIVILQNKRAVAIFLRGPELPEDTRPSGPLLVRRRLADIWHLLAVIYMLLLYGVWAFEIRDGFLFILRATLLTLGLLILAHLVRKGINKSLERGLRVSSELRTRFPGLEARVNRYFPVLHKGINFVIYLLIGLAILDAWGLDTFGWVLSNPGRVLGATLITVLGIVIISVLIWEIVSSLIERYLSASEMLPGRAVSARTRTLLTVARNALLVVLAVVATLMILSELGVNIAPLLAGAGVVGLAVGFGAQKMVQDVITGVMILLQDLMAVGDVVKLGDKAGLVEAISIRTVRLRDLSGTVHTIPFSAIDTVSNLTKEFSFYVFDMGVAYREDVDEVMELLKEVGTELQNDPEIGPLVLAPIEIFGVDAFGNSAVVIKGRIKTQPIKQWAVGRAFNRLVKKKFDERGIEIPFPHQTIYFGQDKDGTAPAAHIQVNPSVAVERSPFEKLEGMREQGAT